MPRLDQPGPSGIAQPGQMFGAYRIERMLGRGGMGVVFLAFDTTLHRHVALKLVDSRGDDEATRARVLREARNAAALNHPHICTIHEVGNVGGAAFIAMEYVNGRSLRDELDAGTVSVHDLRRYGVQAADALAHAHEHGVIHRDFKASNAIIAGGRLKVVDFGLARRDDVFLPDATTAASIVPAGVAAGTPYAMAPEQIRGGAADARTDIWALGVLLYEMAGGGRPFEGGTTPELFSSILRDDPRPLAATVPAALKGVIDRCLSKDPERRYQHAAEVRAALDALEAIGGMSAPARRSLNWKKGLVAAAAALTGDRR